MNCFVLVFVLHDFICVFPDVTGSFFAYWTCCWIRTLLWSLSESLENNIVNLAVLVKSLVPLGPMVHNVEPTIHGSCLAFVPLFGVLSRLSMPKVLSCLFMTLTCCLVLPGCFCSEVVVKQQLLSLVYQSGWFCTTGWRYGKKNSSHPISGKHLKSIMSKNTHTHNWYARRKGMRDTVNSQ